MKQIFTDDVVMKCRENLDTKLSLFCMYKLRKEICIIFFKKKKNCCPNISCSSAIFLVSIDNVFPDILFSSLFVIFVV